MELRIYIDGKDITDFVSVAEAVVELSASGISDNASLTFNDAGRNWGRWEPTVGQTCELKVGKTTLMKSTIDRVVFSDSFCVLDLIASPVARQNACSGHFRNKSLQDVLRAVCGQIGISAGIHGRLNASCPEVRYSHRGGTAVLRDLCDRYDLLMAVSPDKIDFISAEEATSSSPIAVQKLDTDSLSEALGRRIGDFLLTNGESTVRIKKNGQMSVYEVYDGVATESELRTVAEAIVKRRNRASHPVTIRTSYGDSRPIIVPGHVMDYDGKKILILRTRLRWSSHSVEYQGEVV